MTELALQHETLKQIQKTAQEAGGAKDKATTLRVDAEPPEVYYLVTSDGKAERKIADPKARDHELHSLDQVGPFVDEYNGEKPIVWYSESGVVVLLDDTKRRDRATLRLTLTPPMSTLLRLDKEKPKRFSQRDFVRLLRIDLAECFYDKRLLTSVRECDFTQRGDTRGMIQHGRESLGRDIEAAVVSKSTEGIPEDVDLTVRVFDDPSLMDRQAMKCAIELHAAEGQFELVPFPLAVRNAIDLELDVVGKLLHDACPDETPIFRGKP